MYTFYHIIKNAREERGLLLRQVAANLNIDQAIVSKFERGERKPTKDQVLKFANYYGIDHESLLIAWLSDKIIYQLQNEDFAEKVLRVAKKKIKFLKEKNHL